MGVIEHLIGEAILGFSQAEFLLDDVLHKLGLTQAKFEFMGNIRTGNKLVEYRQKVAESGYENSKLLLNLIDRIDWFREVRNSLAHSIILRSMSDDDCYIRHRFRSSKTGIERYTETFSSNQLRDQIRELHEACKSLKELYQDI
ncbi:hypothetical protein ACPUEN_04320 [Algoriphagus yeomjeoni]|uniref:hypothetical protein n=1 Tax=Algoriphagus yeomjeoni TaxID=291403 RepID=UPI003CE4CABC